MQLPREGPLDAQFPCRGQPELELPRSINMRSGMGPLICIPVYKGAFVSCLTPGQLKLQRL